MLSTAYPLCKNRQLWEDIMRHRSKSIIFVFLLPAVLFYGLFYLYPSVEAFRISLYKWTGFTIAGKKYVGLSNFKELLSDDIMATALKNSFLIMFIGGGFLFSMALYFSFMIAQKNIKKPELFQTIIFIPYVINEVGLGLLWVFILLPDMGILNTILRAVGLGFLAKPWLARPQTAFSAVIFAIVWSVIGFYMILLIAGMRNIPSTFYDAARVDGANQWYIFRSITLPLLREVLVVGVIYWVTHALKIFGIIYVMTGGGPFNSTHVITTYMYDNVIPQQGTGYRLGYATAIAVVLFVLVMALSIPVLRMRWRKAIEY